MKKHFIIPFLLLGASLASWAQTTTFNLSGTVKDTKGKGIDKVTVNDGYHFTQTDANGNWALSPDTAMSKFIAISTPAAYVLPQTDGVASGFYVPIKTAVEGNGYDFVLERRKNASDSFYYIAISDPQAKDEKQLTRWKTETTEDIRTLVDSLKELHEVVGMTLGDLVWDNMPLFEDYKLSVKNLGGMTIFQCIGNHDFDQQYQDLHNMETGTPVYGEIVYNRYFGPTDYSFNIGKVHVVTMKNLNYMGHKKYKESMTGAQLAWLKNDLSYLPAGSTVILNMHAAGWNKVSAGGNIVNAKELEEVLKDYNVHVFCGHTHFFQNIQVNDNLYQHNIGAACGAWWRGWVNCCGAPNGYMVVEVNGTDLKWHYKPTRRSFNYQFHVYKPGEFQTQSSFVVANVWDWDTECKVVWYQDGKAMGEMEQFTDADESYAKNFTNRATVERTSHLFRAMPKEGGKEIKIEFTNRFGETYTQTVKL